MPRFFFDMQDGVLIDEPNGMELPSFLDAVAHAEEIVSDLSETRAFAGGKKDSWSLIIRDEDGRLVRNFSFADLARKEGQGMSSVQPL